MWYPKSLPPQAGLSLALLTLRSQDAVLIGEINIGGYKPLTDQDQGLLPLQWPVGSAGSSLGRLQAASASAAVSLCSGTPRERAWGLR